MAEYNVPADLKYYKEHEWLKKLDDGTILIGISDYAQQSLTDVTYVEFTKKVGEEVAIDEIFGEVESVKSVSDLFSPISGKIVALNSEVLEDDPELVNTSSYDKGWMIKLEASNLDEEWAKLMDAEQYKEYIVSL